MYFPIFRGRQYELLALRECVSSGILGDRIIPVVEPVKVSSTFTKTISEFLQAERQIAVVQNPLVGSWKKDIAKEANANIREQYEDQMKNGLIIPTYYVTANLKKYIGQEMEREVPAEKLMMICQNQDAIQFYEQCMTGKKPLYNIIPDRSEFRRRIRPNRVMCEDHFPKRERNADYYDVEQEFFSSDHLYYAEDGYEGFSDYSVVGEEYSETGFAPYAVAIHIVYFDKEKSLRIAHFVSDTNDDISDPARKFAEAVEKLVAWNERMKLDTLGMKAFEEAYRNRTYPGLGVVKKYSIMHHLELMNRYLDGVEA